MDASEVELYEAAGVDLTTVEAARRELRSLDLFQTGSVRAESIVQFRKLTDLVLIHVPRLTQPTCDFTPLSVLQRVTIIECQLVSLECLSLCDSLESVVVDGNQLTSLEPLTSARLPRLRKLWANDNQIASLASLGRLNAVEELSLARNEIATVGHSLDDLAALTSLNLSDNRIGHFREVRQIARLPALRELALSDAHWGDNPVCGLCNYGTFTLCQLPHLQVLDTIVLDEGAKTAAEATFSKKRMYYNMRIKTLKRNTYNVVHRAGVALRSRARALRGGARLLHRSLRDVRRELRFDYAALLLHIRSTELGRESTGDAAAPDQCKAGRGTMALAAATSEALAGYEAASDTAGRLDCLGSPLQPLLDSASPLDDIATNALAAQIRALERLQQRLLWAVAERTLAERSLRWQLSALRETLHGIAAMRTRRLVLELTTGGNIRLEDGTARQVWFRSCADLVQSRFHSRDFASVGVTGVRVRGVTRIHNRHLRAQFDRKMAALLAADEELAQAFASGSQATGPAGFTDAASASSLGERLAGASSPSRDAAGVAAAPAALLSSGSAGKGKSLEYLFLVLPWRGSAGATRSPEAIAEALQRIAEDGLGPRDACTPCPLPPLPPGYAKTILPSFAEEGRTFGEHPASVHASGLAATSFRVALRSALQRSGAGEVAAAALLERLARGEPALLSHQQAIAAGVSSEFVVRSDSAVAHAGADAASGGGANSRGAACSVGVAFTNSLSVADLPRLAEAVAGSLEAAGRPAGPTGWRRACGDAPAPTSLASLPCGGTTDVFRGTLTEPTRRGDGAWNGQDMLEAAGVLQQPDTRGVGDARDAVAWWLSNPHRVPLCDAAPAAADALLASKAALAADVASTGLLKPPGDSAALGHDAMPHEAEPRGVWGSGAAFSSPAVQGGVLVVCKVFMGRCATAEEAVAAQRAAVVAEAKDVASSLMARQEAAAGGATEVLGEYELQEALASAEAATRSGEDLGDGSGEAAGTFGDASPTSRRSVAGGGQQFSALAGWPSQSALRAKRHASVDTPKSMCHSVVSQRRDDPRQRQWVILDPELALPEYIVDFEYVWEVAGGTTVPAAAQQPQAPELGMDGDAAGDARNRTMGEELTLLAEVSLGGRAGRAGDGDVDGEDEETVGGGTAVRLSPQEESDLKPLVRPLARFVELCRGVGATFAADGEAQAEALELAAARVSRTLPELRHGPRDAMVDYLASSAGSKGLLTLRELLSREATLDLHGSGMTSLQVFSGPKQVWSGIRSLVLSFCGLYSLDGIGEGLAALPALTSLDVSFNSIDSLLFSAAAARADGNGTAASSSGAGGPGAGGGAHNRCALAAAPRLKRLLLHDNRISSLGDLPALAEACPRLEELSLAYNPVSLAHMDAERPRGLAPHGIWTGGATELGELALLGLLPVGPPVLHGKGLLPERVVLTGTPWRPHLPGVGGSVSHTRYRSIVLASLPSLQTLDGCALSRPHDATAGGSSSLGGDRGAGTEIVMRQATDTLGERVWPELDDAAVSTAEHGGLPGAPAPSADVLAGEEATREGGDGWAAGQRVSAAKTATVGSVAASTAVLAPARVAPPSTSVVQLAEEAERWASVHAVDVSGCSLQSLAGPGLGRCMNLRRLDASANLLSSLDSLAANRLPKLEELVLEDNRVGSLLDRTGAAALSCVSSSLLRLDLGSNCLTELRGLSSLKRLVQLSVENNELTSIEGLSELSSLLELYAGNNKIRAVKEVRRLRELPKLIILDLCGNPLCGASKYRLFTVYHLRRLKVLDGVSITADEHQEARERYSGRMTVDFLEEKLGAERLATVAELDLSNCRIRDIERLPASRFQCLSKLNLTGNVLTAHGLRGLRQLPHLRELLLPSNKVSTLLPAVQEDPDDADTGEPGDGTAAAESAFAGIQSLDLSSNAVSSIEGLGLSFLPGLRVLNLSRNDVGRLRRVDGCGQLRELSLAANRLRSIDEGALSALRSLRILQLQENGLKVLSALTVLQTLQVLNLSSNRVSDIREVENLAALPYLVDLTLTSNPVARKQLYRPTVLRSLDLLRKLDGREASEEEKAHAAQLFAEGGGTMPGIYMGGGSTEVGGPSAASMAGRVPVRMAAVSFGNVLATSSGSSTAPMQQLQGHMMMQQAQLQMRVSSPRAQAGGMATVAAASASTAGMMGRAGLRVAHGISAAAARDTSLSVGVKPMGLATVGIASGRDASAGLAAAGRAATRWGAAAGVAPSRPRMSYLSAGGLSARGVGQVGAAATRTGHRQVRRARVSPRGARGTSTTEVGGDRPGRR